MLLGMTAKTSEREKPPFETPFETQGKQGPATSFVVGCAFAPVAGALGYKAASSCDATISCEASVNAGEAAN